jgi:hypothetical protein
MAVYLIAALSARAGSKVHTGNERSFAAFATAAVVSAIAHGAILSLYVEPTYTLAVSLLLGLATVAGGEPDLSMLPWRRKRTPRPAV